MELLIPLVIGLIVIAVLFKLAKGAIKLFGIVVVLAIIAFFVLNGGGA